MVKNKIVAFKIDEKNNVKNINYVLAGYFILRLYIIFVIVPLINLFWNKKSWKDEF
jgi:hypothetical protein